MTRPQIEAVQPLVVAHRGASSREPENTLRSFEAALRDGADVIEVDVRLTADGVPVILHDPDVAPTTDGSGPVHTMTLEQVKALDASGGRGPHEEIPTLAEALAVVSGTGTGIDLEIKNIPGEASFDSPTEAVLGAALRALEDTGFEGDVLVSSFNWLTIERSLELRPDLDTGFLTIAAVDPRASLDYVRQKGHVWVLPQAPALLEAGEAFVQEAHGEGVRVGTWTVDEEETLGLLFGWGVDAVASNVPALAVRIRDRVVAAS